MSKYTTRLIDIMEEETEKHMMCGTPFSEIQKESRPLIFKDVNERFKVTEFLERFENLFLERYAMCEICCETYQLWKIYLLEKITCTHDFYYEKYKLLNLQYNIMNEYERNKNSIRGESRNATETSETTINNNGNTRQSDTPQGTLDNIETNKYLTNAEITENKTDETGKGQKNECIAENFSENENGHNSSITYLIKERLEILTNLYDEWLNECSVLFMQIW